MYQRLHGLIILTAILVWPSITDKMYSEDTILRSVIPTVYIRATGDQWSRNSSQNTTISVCTITYQLHVSTVS